MAFEVDDIDAVVAGCARVGERAGWLYDSEGNLLGLGQAIRG